MPQLVVAVGTAGGEVLAFAAADGNELLRASLGHAVYAVAMLRVVLCCR